MNTEKLADIVRDIAERYRQAGYFPSASIRVFDKDQNLCAVQVGDCDENSIFDVASLTKIATATQILLFAEQGKINLEDEVSGVFPEIRDDSYLSQRLQGVTIYRLLTHTSSMRAWFPFYSRLGEDFYSVLKYALVHSEPTEGVVYSDLNFMLLGKLCEKLSGLPLEKSLQETLVKPYGLGLMTYLPDKSLPAVPSDYGNAIEQEMCRTRNITFDGFRPLGVPVTHTTNDGNAHYYFDDVAGHAGIFAHPSAYEKLCQLYMNAVSSLFIKAQQEQPTAPGRGIGLQTGASYPYGCGHTGFTGTGIYFSREYNIGVISFTNRLFYPEKNENATGDFRRALQEAVFTVNRLG